MRSAVTVLGVLILAAAAIPVAAQNPGLPVYNSGVPRGISLYGDLGFPNAQGGGGTVYGATARAGLGLFGVSASLSSFDPGGSSSKRVSVGGTLNYRLLGGPLVPLSVTLQGGVSYRKLDNNPLPNSSVNAYHFPVGIGFALVIPNPVLAIQPWLAPRLDIAYQKAGGPSTTETHFGLSGGLELNLLNGFGVQAAYDRVFAKNRGDPSTFGVGLHYSFRVPGL